MHRIISTSLAVRIGIAPDLARRGMPGQIATARHNGTWEGQRSAADIDRLLQDTREIINRPRHGLQAVAPVAIELQLIGKIRNFDSRVSAWRDALASRPNASVNLYVSSDGGDLQSALDLNAILRKHPGRVSARIVNECSSAASVACMGADRLEIDKNAFMFIHNPHFPHRPNLSREDRRRLLINSRDQIVAAYSRRANISESHIKRLMRDGTKLTASEAVRYGFADSIS